jgi:hypothetical protein
MLMQDEYDFSNGVRGKYAKRYSEGTKLVELMSRLPKHLAASVRAMIDAELCKADWTRCKKHHIYSVERFGLPFVKAHSDMSSLCAALSEYSISDAHFRRPIAYRLMGQEQKAQASIEDTMKNIEQRIDPAAELFRKFVMNFRRLP